MRWAGLLLAAIVLSGCGRGTRSDDPTDEANLGPTIGSVAQVSEPQPTIVDGFGVVAGLPGTGSGACPTGLRPYLKQYILAQTRDRAIDVDDFIKSDNTAVVWLEGTIPATASPGDTFDVRVRPVAGADTTSLHGGWLYTAELRRRASSGIRGRALATAEGPVFVNTIGTTDPDGADGYVIGGATARFGYTGVLRLRRPDFGTASAIRNRLNERYGVDTAAAVSATDVAFVIPAAYQRRKARFVSMVAATYVSETAQLVPTRVDAFVAQLAGGGNKQRSEIALEAIGRRCLPKLAALLKSPDEEVRLRAARCAMSLGDDRALEPLRTMALETTSPYRLDALAAVAASGQRNDATALARRLLRDRDTSIVLAAYEHLREMEDMAVRQEFVGRSFYLEHVTETDRQAIFVARSGDPRIVIFGPPLKCRDNLFVESPNQMVVVNSRAGEDYATLTRQEPNRDGVIGPIRCALSPGEIVRALGSEQSSRGGGPSGLGTSYSDIAAVLEQMCAKGGLAAEFWPGPLPKNGLIVKK